VELTVSEKCRKCIELNGDYVEKLSVVCNISILLYGRVAGLLNAPRMLPVTRDNNTSHSHTSTVGRYKEPDIA